MAAFHHRGARIALVHAVMRGELALETAVATAGITPTELLAWLREHGHSAEPAMDDLRLSIRDRRLRELRRQVRRLEIQLASLRVERIRILRMLSGGPSLIPPHGMSPPLGDKRPHENGDVAPLQLLHAPEMHFSLTRPSGHS